MRRVCGEVGAPSDAWWAGWGGVGLVWLAVWIAGGVRGSVSGAGREAGRGCAARVRRSAVQRLDGWVGRGVFLCVQTR